MPPPQCGGHRRGACDTTASHPTSRRSSARRLPLNPGAVAPASDLAGRRRPRRPARAAPAAPPPAMPHRPAGVSAPSRCRHCGSGRGLCATLSGPCVPAARGSPAGARALRRVVACRGLRTRRVAKNCPKMGVGGPAAPQSTSAACVDAIGEALATMSAFTPTRVHLCFRPPSGPQALSAPPFLHCPFSQPANHPHPIQFSTLAFQPPARQTARPPESPNELTENNYRPV